MFKTPTSRRKSKREGITLNLVPMLDALITLIAFLLFTMSFLVLTAIESPIPLASTPEDELKLKKKPLQLTLSIDIEDSEIWSPFDLIQSVRIKNTSGGVPDIYAIHQELVKVKEKFPTERNIVFVPHAGVSYDTLVALMDTAREIEETDPPIFIKNKKTGLDKAVKKLFDKIIYGNLMGAN